MIVSSCSPRRSLSSQVREEEPIWIRVIGELPSADPNQLQFAFWTPQPLWRALLHPLHLGMQKQYRLDRAYSFNRADTTWELLGRNLARTSFICVTRLLRELDRFSVKSTIGHPGSWLELSPRLFAPGRLHIAME